MKLLPCFRLPLVPIALLPLAGVAGAQSPWGLRNLEFVDQWSAAEFGTEFTSHEAGHLAFWTFWGDFQPCEPALGTCPFEPGRLETGLSFAQEIGAVPVIVFHLTADLLAEEEPPCSFWAMNFAGANIGPDDLVQPTEPDPCPDPNASYSDSLYCVSLALAQYIVDGDLEGVVYLRFFNEAWGDWPLGSDPDQSLYNYLLSYLTFRKAVLDVQATTTDVEFRISHGSLPRERITQRALWEQGDASGSEQVRADIAQRLDALIERNRCEVGNKYPALVANPGDPAYINTWAKATIYAGPSSSYNVKQDAWLDSYVAWTADCAIFDFTTAHPHGKPALIHSDRVYFDDAVVDAGGTPPEWLGAEVAFQLSDQENWGVHPDPGDDLDKFIAEDLARKWCTLLANATAFCSPIVAGYPGYRGLYRARPQPETFCGVPVNCEETPALCQPLGSECTAGGPSGPDQQVICDDPANAAFRFLSDTIGSPNTVITFGTPDDSHSHYRYQRSGSRVDAIWRNELADGNTSTSNVQVAAPANYYCATVYDVFGNVKQSAWVVSGNLTVTNLGQAPRVIVWHCKLQPH